MEISFIVYNKGRKCSDIKFESIDEVKQFVKWHYLDYKPKDNIYNIFEYPTGNFKTTLMVEEGEKTYTLIEMSPLDVPRRRNFNNKK